MARKAIQISISSKVKALLEKELNRHKIERHYAMRMQIIYHSEKGKTNQQVSQVVGCHENTVRKWRKRWQTNQSILEEFEWGYEQTQIPQRELKEKIKEILSDIPRIGSPARITETEINRLTTLACESPESYGLPFTGWTHVELSKQAKKMGIIVSPAHLGRILKKRFTSP